MSLSYINVESVSSEISTIYVIPNHFANADFVKFLALSNIN